MYVCNTPHTGCHHLGYLFLRGWYYLLFIPNTLLLFVGPLGGREKERERTKLPTVLVLYLVTATGNALYYKSLTYLYCIAM